MSDKTVSSTHDNISTHILANTKHFADGVNYDLKEFKSMAIILLSNKISLSSIYDNISTYILAVMLHTCYAMHQRDNFCKVWSFEA